MHTAPTAQQANQPLRQLCQALWDRLEQPQGTDQATTPPTDLQAFLAALQATAHHSAQTANEATGLVEPNAPPNGWMPLDKETRTHVTTAVMCHHLGRAEQTARIWAMRQTGPLQAIRVNGRLHWAVADIRKLLGVA